MSLLLKNATLPSGRKADVLVEGSKIAEIAPSIPASGADKIDASSKLLLPGFINTHTHAAMALFRGIAEDMPLSGWLSRVRAVETKLTPQQARAGGSACLP